MPKKGSYSLSPRFWGKGTGLGGSSMSRLADHANSSRVTISDEARDIHREFPAVDLHVDSLMWMSWAGYNFAQSHQPPLPRSAWFGQVDLPRLEQGGIGAVFFGLVSLPVGNTRGMAAVVHKQIDELDRLIGKVPERVRLAATSADVTGATGKVSALLGIEGAHALDGDLENLERFAARGVRYLGLAHFSDNEVCAPAKGFGAGADKGLTSFGRSVVERAEALNVIVDLAHISRRGFFDAVEMSKKPVMVTHTGVLGVYDHWRNIDDDQLRAVAKAEGVVGVMFCPQFLGGDGLDPVVRHLEHIINVCGEDTPALGSDWDGMIVPTKGLAQASELPNLTDAMIRAGWSRARIGKILRLNALRMLEPQGP